MAKQKDLFGQPQKRFQRPTLEDIRAYVVKMGYTIDPEHFFAYNEARDWYIGKSRIKNWKAAVTTWQIQEKKFANRGIPKPVDDFDFHDWVKTNG